MAGTLIYLMGPSGAGKDSVLQAARPILEAEGCRIARRVITRSAEAAGEDALGVSPEAFEQRVEAGAFALHWRANGLAYGIPRDLDDWLAAGHSVLVNGSRAHLPVARQRYPDLLAVLLSVEPDVLRQRLLARGRETAEQIEARLRRSAELTRDLGVEAGDWVRIDNSGPLTHAVSALVELVGRTQACG
ncbi:phosphonate metabolism protein/1,5-bisphosphokinase (PRPP-forming) PhnN [Stutzerimonas urumqiensis]|uniref:phosphonate metabolism protein/1,5-bisphosphokinase (PRPP-forming) PhnN n=1 Tax=Stutzerimonas urumqiensis TaxID=638269 RepID=UPI003DA2A965